ncbi:MAG: hypothetical protein ISS15_10600 [Alphaproteobacteria bacterium]|nr:hypothetical protein [Alphaproteobacteria bacterium]MBL7098098.1 hypothetical protein [Alphaproteobacteria bacterium]
MAADDVPITCKLIDAQAAGRLLGGSLGRPQFENIVVCAGWCPGQVQPACTFALADAPRGGATKVVIGLALSPFGERDLRQALYVVWSYGTPPGDIRKLPWPQGSALWFFQNSDIASIDVFLGPPSNLCADLSIRLIGVTNRERARALIEQLMRPAVARLARATRDELVLPGWVKHKAIDRQSLCVNRFRTE